MELNKENVLSSTDRGLDIFRHYIVEPFRIGHNFFNPLYEDTNASCNIFYNRHGSIYRLKDFGNDSYSGDCFDFVGQVIGLDSNNSKEFIQILQAINRDLHLGLSSYERYQSESQRAASSQKQNNPKNNSNISNNKSSNRTNSSKQEQVKEFKFTPKSFSDAELTFWGKYGISEQILDRYCVLSLKEYSSINKEGKPFSLQSSLIEPMYGYQGKEWLKVYRPQCSMRFLYGGHVNSNYCFGLEQLPRKGDTLFITGGEKDVLSLAAHGFNAICFNSESSQISKSIIRKLSYRFKHTVLLYDVDSTGLEASLKHQSELSDFKVQRLVLPLKGTKADKDISDYFKSGKTGKDFHKLFIRFLNSLYSETMAMLKSCEIDFGNPPNHSECVISINDVPLGSEGNIFCITGGEGTGKSSYVGSLIAGTLCAKKCDIDLLGTTVMPNMSKQAVLVYDTEQSEVQLYKNMLNVFRRSGQPHMPFYFKSYCLSGMSRQERLQSIINSMDKFYYEFGGIHLVVIDGIADLIRCANDEVESIAVVDELYRLASIYQTCIVGVLHFTPNGLKLRGHLGSEVQRKAASILSIERDTSPEISVIKALKVRDGSPLDVPLIQFVWDKEKGMHTYHGVKSKEEKEQRKKDELLLIARKIFEQFRFLAYMELCEQIQKQMDVKERTAKSYIKFMKDNQMIKKEQENGDLFILA